MVRRDGRGSATVSQRYARDSNRALLAFQRTMTRDKWDPLRELFAWEKPIMLGDELYRVVSIPSRCRDKTEESQEEEWAQKSEISVFRQINFNVRECPMCVPRTHFRDSGIPVVIKSKAPRINYLEVNRHTDRHTTHVHTHWGCSIYPFRVLFYRFLPRKHPLWHNAYALLLSVFVRVIFIFDQRVYFE